MRVGFTVSRQVGNAVERNRVRRRLREMVRLATAGSLHAGHDYVLIGRRAALEAAVRRDDAGTRCGAAGAFMLPNGRQLVALPNGPYMKQVRRPPSGR